MLSVTVDSFSHSRYQTADGRDLRNVAVTILPQNAGIRSRAGSPLAAFSTSRYHQRTLEQFTVQLRSPIDLAELERDTLVLIRHTLVYTMLVAVLAGTDLGYVLVLSVVFRTVTGTSQPLIVTLATAALVRPAHARLRDCRDRRFYRQRYDAAQTLAPFTSPFRVHTDLDTIETQILQTRRVTVRPAHASIWLRSVTIPGRKPGTTEMP
jgi:hypothetical protein